MPRPHIVGDGLAAQGEHSKLELGIGENRTSVRQIRVWSLFEDAVQHAAARPRGVNVEDRGVPRRRSLILRFAMRNVKRGNLLGVTIAGGCAY